MSSFTPGSDRHENDAAQDRELRVWALTRVGVSREKAEAQVDDVLARGLVAPLTSDERARLQRARQEAESRFLRLSRLTPSTGPSTNGATTEAHSGQKCGKRENDPIHGDPE